MSDKPEIELDLDLQLLPSWARQPQEANRYANFEDRGGPDRRGPRGRGPDGPRRDFRGEGRFGGPGGGPRGRGPRPGGGPGGGPGGRPGFRGDRGGRRPEGPPRREPIEDLPEGITVDLIPEPTGVDSLTKQIRQTGRAYPLFDIGHLILKRPDRYQLEFRATGNLADGTPRQLFVNNLDDLVWLTEGEAVRHVLNRHFDTFYSTEKIPVDPPKGTYTFVAQCGMSGVILGPPNLHDYQAKLQRLHSERFSRMPFDVYKSRIKIVRDEAVVKKWVEEQSFKFEYTCLNVPEPQKFSTREAVEQHFREVHLPSIVRGVPSHVVRTPAARDSLPAPLRRLARREFDLQLRFPLKLVTRLSDEFAHRGLHFFKVNKTVLHVAVARPRFLDLEANPVTDGVKRILEAIQNTPDCNRRKLLETLGVELPVTPEPAADGTPTPEPPPSPELQSIITDLHWLIHEGHVIEFANGRLEAAKRPPPRPQAPPRPPKAKPAEAAATATPAETEAANDGTSAPSAPEGTPVEGAAVATEAAAAPASETPAPAEAPADPAAAATAPAVEPATTPAPVDASPAESIAPPVETPESVPTPPPAAEAPDDESRINPS